MARRRAENEEWDEGESDAGADEEAWTVDERQSRPLIERPFASWDEARPTQRLTTAVYRSPGYRDLAPRWMY